MSGMIGKGRDWVVILGCEGCATCLRVPSCATFDESCISLAYLVLVLQSFTRMRTSWRRDTSAERGGGLMGLMAERDPREAIGDGTCLSREV